MLKIHELASDSKIFSMDSPQPCLESLPQDEAGADARLSKKTNVEVAKLYDWTAGTPRPLILSSW